MKRKRFYLVIAVVFALLLFLSGCQSSSSSGGDSTGDSIGGGGDDGGTSGFLMEKVSESGGSTFTYSKDFGSTERDVYFIFTNPTSSTIYDDVVVELNQASERLNGIRRSERIAFKPSDSLGQNRLIDTQPLVLKDRPELLGKETPLIPSREERNLPAFSVIATQPQRASVGDTNDFLDYDFNTSSNITISSTLQKVVTGDSMTLNLWVADDSWEGGGCAKASCLNDDKLTAFGAMFLKDGEDNDIYDWVSGIYGAPWGTHSNSTYIAASAAGQIDILFYDIDNNDDDTSGGVTLGYFWAKDNAVKDPADTTNYTDISNERLIFYMDSVMAAEKEDATWEITDYWPAIQVSTLAHEFQHMIHFYQKTLTRAGASSETWINEMASMVAEDLVASKIEIDGPRGVAYNDFSAGSAGNTDGRLPNFNYRNRVALTDWYSGSDVFYSYAISYAFGAYIARNYGGAALFQNIVQSDYTDYQAVTEGLAATGYTETFESLLINWGIAVIASDQTDASTNYRYNTGNSFSSTLNSVEYKLGSINLFNFDPEPSLVDLSQYHINYMYKASNAYCIAAQGVSGEQSWEITMPAGIKMTMVAK